MQSGKTKSESRVRESWRARACAAGLCAGAQIFLFGTGCAMTLALNGAWVAALVTLPLAVLTAALCRRAHAGERKKRRRARGLYALLALTLAANAAFAVLALISFAEQTLLTQTPMEINALITASFVFCSALSGGTGVARLCFALRFALPALLAVLTLASVPLQVPAGLFPLLGAGIWELGAAALSMLGAVSPVLMLLLPPPELKDAGAAAMKCPVPRSRFFTFRVLAGAGAGVLFLMAASVCTTYESIAESAAWGARMRIAASNRPHEGIPQMLLIALQAIAAALLASNMLSAAAQAMEIALKGRAKKSVCLAGLALLVLLTAFAGIALGFDVMLSAAPLLAFPLGALLIFHKRLGDA